MFDCVASKVGLEPLVSRAGCEPTGTKCLLLGPRFTVKGRVSRGEWRGASGGGRDFVPSTLDPRHSPLDTCVWILPNATGLRNPEGWQTVAGGRSRVDQGRTTTGRLWSASAPRSGCQSRRHVRRRLGSETTRHIGAGLLSVGSCQIRRQSRIGLWRTGQRFRSGTTSGVRWFLTHAVPVVVRPLAPGTTTGYRLASLRVGLSAKRWMTSRQAAHPQRQQFAHEIQPCHVRPAGTILEPVQPSHSFVVKLGS